MDVSALPAADAHIVLDLYAHWRTRNIEFLNSIYSSRIVPLMGVGAHAPTVYPWNIMAPVVVSQVFGLSRPVTSVRTTLTDWGPCAASFYALETKATPAHVVLGIALCENHRKGAHLPLIRVYSIAFVDVLAMYTEGDCRPVTSIDVPTWLLSREADETIITET